MFGGCPRRPAAESPADAMTCSADRHSITAGDHVQITASASDPDNDPLSYTWRTSGGQIVGSGASVSFDTSRSPRGP